MDRETGLSEAVNETFRLQERERETIQRMCGRNFTHSMARLQQSQTMKYLTRHDEAQLWLMKVLT